MRKSFAAVAGLVLAVAGSPALSQTSDQFDLVCKGTQQTRTGEPATAWNERFRLDLRAKRWCRGACATASEIATVTDDNIQIYHSRVSIGGPAEAELNISRTGGEIREAVSMGWSGGAATLAEGQCERAFFSGLPEQRF